jgi:hypothetical protein
MPANEKLQILEKYLQKKGGIFYSQNPGLKTVEQSEK